MLKSRSLYLVIALSIICSVTSYAFPEKLSPAVSFPLPVQAGETFVVYPSLNAPEGLVVLLENGSVTFLNGKGETCWTTRIGARIGGPLAAGDLDGDGKAEIATVAGSTGVCALSAKGEILWRYPLPGEVGAWKGPTLADLDGDKAAEVLISDDAGWMTCLSGSGVLRWRIRSDPYRGGQCSVGDVDGDGKPEIVYGTESGRIICLDYDGNVKWIHKGKSTDKYGRSYTALADLDGDGLSEAVYSTSFNAADSRVYALHALDGTPCWDVKTNLHGYGSCSVGDLNEDGTPEVLFGDRANTLYAIGGDGKELWRTTTGGHGYMFPQNIVDVDGNGHVEVLAVCRSANSQGKSFFILDGRDGKILADYPLVNSKGYSPTVCDLDRDGNQEMILISSAGIDLYRMGAKAEALAPWPTKRHDSSRTGFVPSTARPKTISPAAQPAEVLKLTQKGPVLPGENWLGLEARSPSPDSFWEISMADTQGEVQRRLLKENDPAFLQYNCTRPGEYTITVTQWNETSDPAKPVARGTLKVSYAGVATLEAWLEEAKEKVLLVASQVESTRPAASRLLFEKTAVLEGQLAHISQLAGRVESQAFPERDPLIKEVHGFHVTVESVLHLSALVQSSIRASFSIVADANPWNNTFETAQGISLWTCQGESGHLALAVTNLRPEAADIQFRPPLQGPLTLREVIPVPQKVGDPIPDALALIGQSHTLHFAPGETRTLWIDVSAKNLTPGQHEIPLEILPIGVETDRTTVNITVEVAPVNLVDAPEFSICNWANPLSLQQLTGEPGVAQQFLEQGMTVWLANAPGRSCDQDGNLTGKADWTSLDQQLDLLDPNKAILLFGGPGVGTPPEVEEYSPAWKKGLQNTMRELAAHLAEKGWPLSRWAYYPMDEPGLFGDVAVFTQRVTAAKEVCPEIQIYANPAGGVSRALFQDLVDDVDVWSPELALLRREPDLVNFFHETQDWLWSYEAPGDVKTLLPLGYYRAQCLTAFSMGLVGTGHWVFVSPNKGDDLWTAFSSSGYGDMYYDGSQLVPSRRWFAFMDGAEDARFLLLLKATAAEVRRRGLTPPELAEVDTLLNEKLNHLIRTQWEQDDISRNIVDYELDFSELQSLRKETARLTQVLRARIMEGKD